METYALSSDSQVSIKDKKPRSKDFDRLPHSTRLLLATLALTLAATVSPGVTRTVSADVLRQGELNPCERTYGRKGLKFVEDSAANGKGSCYGPGDGITHARADMMYIGPSDPARKAQLPDHLKPLPGAENGFPNENATYFATLKSKPNVVVKVRANSIAGGWMAENGQVYKHSDLKFLTNPPPPDPVAYDRQTGQRVGLAANQQQLETMRSKSPAWEIIKLGGYTYVAIQGTAPLKDYVSAYAFFATQHPLGDKVLSRSVKTIWFAGVVYQAYQVLEATSDWTSNSIRPADPNPQSVKDLPPGSSIIPPAPSIEHVQMNCQAYERALTIMEKLQEGKGVMSPDTAVSIEPNGGDPKLIPDKMTIRVTDPRSSTKGQLKTCLRGEWH